MNSIMQILRKLFAAMAFANVDNLSDFNRLLDEHEHMKSTHKDTAEISTGRDVPVASYKLAHR